MLLLAARRPRAGGRPARASRGAAERRGAPRGRAARHPHRGGARLRAAPAPVSIRPTRSGSPTSPPSCSRAAPRARTGPGARSRHRVRGRQPRGRRRARRGHRHARRCSRRTSRSGSISSPRCCCSPRSRPSELTRKVTDIQAAIQRSEQEPGDRGRPRAGPADLSRASVRAARSTAPSNRSGGSRASRSSPSTGANYRPDAAVIVVVGDVTRGRDPPRAAARAWAAGPRPADPACAGGPEAPTVAARRVARDRPGPDPGDRARSAARGSSRTIPDYFPLVGRELYPRRRLGLASLHAVREERGPRLLRLQLARPGPVRRLVLRLAPDAARRRGRRPCGSSRKRWRA